MIQVLLLGSSWWWLSDEGNRGTEEKSGIMEGKGQWVGKEGVEESDTVQ